MKYKMTFLSALTALLIIAGGISIPKPAQACFQCPCQFAQAVATQGFSDVRRNITSEHQSFQRWMVTNIFQGHILPATMQMTEQLSTVAMQQLYVIGTFLDAKHQLETQRVLQTMQARAHKDYHPSEGLCVVGTNVRALAASNHTSDFNTVVVSNRTMQRQLLSGDVLSAQGMDSDRISRLDQFKRVYCDINDNARGLQNLCGNSAPNANRRNKDIDYTRTIDAPLTIGLDFADTTPSEDEEDVFALAANLFAHEVPPQVGATVLADENTGAPNYTAANTYMYLRSVMAKRSVAQNSFASIAALKSQGSPEVRPFLYAILSDMGIDNAEIQNMLGENPSYFAQMEVLTKKMYQHPNFYTDLYDKPTNVARKKVAMQAIDLMQKRDMFRSLLRSEASMSVLLELAVDKEQAKYRNEEDSGSQEGVSTP